MADNQDSPNDDEKQAELDQKLNAVVKSHLRRELKALNLDQSIQAAITKAMEAQAAAVKPEEGKGRTADGKFTSEKVDPQVKALMDAQARIERELKEERDRRISLEVKAKKEAIRAQMRTGLEAKGIKGKRLEAAVIMLENQNLIEQEGGDPVFRYARSRGKGAPVEEMDFDISSGIQDWLNGPDAADFLPAPTVNAQRTGNQVNRTGQPKKPVYDKPAKTVEEMMRRTTEQLAALGIDASEALKNS